MVDTRRVPSVHLNLNVRGLKQSATVAINDRSNELIRQGKLVTKLGLGQSPFPVPEHVVESLRVNAAQKAYLPTRGLRELRQAVADYHRRVDGVAMEADGILIGPGSKELMFLLQLAYYGDWWCPRRAGCRMRRRPDHRPPVRFVQTTYEQGWRITPTALRELCEEDPDRPRILIINYPGNPDGNTYTAEELEALADVARSYEVIILSDEIYGPLNHHGTHASIARYYPGGTIISGGLSKWSGAGGWRLGTFAFPSTMKWLLETMVSLASETFTSTSAPIQYAACAAFRGGLAMETYLTHCRRVLGALGIYSTTRLRAAGARMVDPKGAFYLFPDFEPIREQLAARGITNSRIFCERALEEARVAFLPGESFGMPESTLTVRLAYVDFDGARALLAAEAVPLDQDLDEEFLREYCQPAMAGIDALCDWISG